MRNLPACLGALVAEADGLTLRDAAPNAVRLATPSGVETGLLVRGPLVDPVCLYNIGGFGPGTPMTMGTEDTRTL